jgi:hypothetical protein
MLERPPRRSGAFGHGTISSLSGSITPCFGNRAAQPPWLGPLNGGSHIGHHTALNETLRTRGRLLAFPGSFLGRLFRAASPRWDADPEFEARSDDRHCARPCCSAPRWRSARHRPRCTGLVVVGDLIGTGSAQQQAVVGETPNLAARLQAIAEPNTVTKIAGQSVRADAPLTG